MVGGPEITRGSARSRQSGNPQEKHAARGHAITEDFGSKLIRNQQVVRSIRIAGSKIYSKF
jgi:hypothetical protein